MATEMPVKEVDNMHTSSSSEDEGDDMELAFVGTYTDYKILAHSPCDKNTPGEGIYTLQVLKDGTMKLVHKAECCNPAILKMHPTLPVMYALEECIHSVGIVKAFNVSKEGQLTYLGEASAKGRSTCSINFADDRTILLANYWDGTIDVMSLSDDGCPDQVTQTIEHMGLIPGQRQVVSREDHLANRQAGPHTHCIAYCSGKWLISDLGCNAVIQYSFNPDTRRLERDCMIPLPKDVAGPRHIVHHPSLPVLYVSCELSSSVAVFAVAEAAGPRPCLEFKWGVSTLPADYQDTSHGKVSVGEIKVTECGRFAYVSNRGHSSIAIFRIDQTSGRLQCVDTESTRGSCPRHFTVLGRMLIVANQDSSTCERFRIRSDGTLEYIKEGSVRVPTPNYVYVPGQTKLHTR